jgi:hypothetical protein
MESTQAESVLEQLTRPAASMIAAVPAEEFPVIMRTG